MRALTRLKQAGLAAQESSAVGRAPEMPIHKIHLDPNNARRPEDENSPEGREEQCELTQDIKKRGVKSPVSLRPHPTIAGEYMLNYGHRRVKGAIEAGLATIPYFIDVNFDSYDQVKENLLHRKPSIWALAEFVQRRLDEGQSKGEIAEGLGKTDQNLVTELQALVDAPICLHKAYASGVRSTRTLYDLRRAYEDYPEQTEAWCVSAEKITRETIRSLLAQVQTGAVEKQVATKVIEETDEPGQAKRSALKADAEAGTAYEEGAQLTVVPAAALGLGGIATAPTPQTEKLLEQLPSKLRHDVKTRGKAGEPLASLASANSVSAHTWIMVEFKGKPARIAPDATVLIILDGDDSPLSVPVADLAFVKLS